MKTMFKNFWPNVWIALGVAGFTLSRLTRYHIIDRETGHYLFIGFTVLAGVIYLLSKHRYAPYR